MLDKLQRLDHGVHIKITRMPFQFAVDRWDSPKSKSEGTIRSLAYYWHAICFCAQAPALVSFSKAQIFHEEGYLVSLY